jgi:hypothetical protein
LHVQRSDDEQNFHFHKGKVKQILQLLHQQLKKGNWITAWQKETAETALTAALLNSYKAEPKGRNSSKRGICRESKDHNSGDDESNEGKSSCRYQDKLVRDIMARSIDLVLVGVPDIRVAVSFAIYCIGVAMLDS